MGIEATAIIAREKRAQLRDRGCTPAFLDSCADFLHTPGISIVRDAQVAVQAGRVTAMHDPTEGGVATGLWELATASAVGAEIDSHALLIDSATTRVSARPLNSIPSA